MLFFITLLSLFLPAAGGSAPFQTDIFDAVPVNGPAVVHVGTAEVAQDTASFGKLDLKLKEYLDRIVAEPIGIQQQEVDFLISQSKDSAVRQHIALKIYDYYVNSPVMGVEAVAVFLTDNWFSPQKVKMKSDIDLMNAKIFADFNRQSLLGLKAPELVLQNMDGRVDTLFSSSSGSMKILYFYDTDCVKCRIETPQLRELFDRKQYDADFIAVYVGDDRNHWEQYVNTVFSSFPESARLSHYWDASLESGFQLKYGVLQTPSLFLIDGQNFIVGRKLNAAALEQLLDSYAGENSYGNPEYSELFGKVFSGLESVEEVKGTVDYIASSAGKAQDPASASRKMLGELLYYFASERGEIIKEGEEYLIDKYILGSDLWTSNDDSLKVVAYAEGLKSILSLSKVGEKVPDIKVPSLLLSGNRHRQGFFSLRRFSCRDTYILFYTESCNICKGEIDAAMRLHSQPSGAGLNVLLVNMDEIMAKYPEIGERLFGEFDLSALPYVTLISRKGIVLRKYVSLTD